MKWYEYYIDDDGNTQYYVCKICEKHPAFALTHQDDYVYGPWCQTHWIEHVNVQFENLRSKLDMEDWGSSPETRKEVCARCNQVFPNRLGMVGLKVGCNEIPLDICWSCYDEEAAENNT